MRGIFILVGRLATVAVLAGFLLGCGGGGPDDRVSSSYKPKAPTPKQQGERLEKRGFPQPLTNCVTRRMKRTGADGMTVLIPCLKKLIRSGAYTKEELFKSLSRPVTRTP